MKDQKNLFIYQSAQKDKEYKNFHYKSKREVKAESKDMIKLNDLNRKSSHMSLMSI